MCIKMKKDDRKDSNKIIYSDKVDVSRCLHKVIGS